MNATPIPRAGRSSIIAVCAIIANDIPTRLPRPAAITLTMVWLLPPERSSVRLDKFVYDPNKSGGALASQVTRGSFRFLTESQGGSYEIKSSYGILGIRG